MDNKRIWDDIFHNISGNWYWVGKNPKDLLNNSYLKTRWSSSRQQYVFAIGDSTCNGEPQIAQGMSRKDIVELIRILSEILAEDS